MPHGAGHVGGGGFHGGGFHGGGFHHHGGGFGHHRFGHRHHHHHHRGGWWWWGWGGPGYYYGSPGYYAYRRIWGCACFWIWLLVALVIVAISVGASVGPSSKSSERHYTPGDTRLAPVDSTFCSGISVSGSNPLLEATFYALYRPPALTSWNNFTLFESSVAVPRRGYVYYQFYLHRGSTANGSSCIPPGSLVTSLQFLIIKGTSNFNSWVKRPSTSRTVQSYTVRQTCPSSLNFKFQVTTDDYYFFVYYNSGGFSGSVRPDILFHSTEYTLNQSAVLRSCHYDGIFPCSISTSARATYMLVVSGQQPATEFSDFSLDCIANGGIIAAIVLVPLLVLALVVSMVIVLACYCRYKHGKKAATTTTSTGPSASDPMIQPAQPEVPTAATVVNVTTNAPPAYNPNYPTDAAAPPPYASVAPSYGSTQAKPQGI